MERSVVATESGEIACGEEVVVEEKVGIAEGCSRRRSVEARRALQLIIISSRLVDGWSVTASFFIRSLTRCKCLVCFGAGSSMSEPTTSS